MITRDFPLYQEDTIFFAYNHDNPVGDYNNYLIDKYNKYVSTNDSLYRLNFPKYKHSKLPSKVIILERNDPHLQYLCSYESARVIREYLNDINRNDIEVIVVNQREKLDELLSLPDRKNFLILSQTANRSLYDKRFAEELEDIGIIVVPGVLTAPGSILSNKEETYNLLSNNGKDFKYVAPYYKCELQKTRGKIQDAKCITESIINTIDNLSIKWNCNDFFVKPIELAGGGLGAFRISKVGKKYLLPSLYQLTGNKKDNFFPYYLEIDLNNENKLKELNWLIKVFSSKESLKKKYIKFSDKGLLDTLLNDNSLSSIKKYIDSSNKKVSSLRSKYSIDRDSAIKKLNKAIKVFENKYQRNYNPIISKYVDFGNWSLRVYLRLTRRGIEVETMYLRLFQLSFTDDGIGYIGLDNITDKHTNQFEYFRCLPLNEINVKAIGGERKFFKLLDKSAFVMKKMMDTQDSSKIFPPLRIEVDIAPQDGVIIEGNADGVYDLAVDSNWDRFEKNTREWFEDSLRYFSMLC